MIKKSFTKRFWENVVELLVENYQAYYKKQNLMISLEKTGETKPPILRSKVSGGGNRAEIYVEQNLGNPYQAYRISYQKRLLDFEEVWRMLKGMFAAVSLVMSVLLCLILDIFMRRMLKPLGRLNEGVARIAAGEYGKANVCRNQSFWTRDEISELSENINKMSETIQLQIETLKDENYKKQQLMDNMAHELKTPLTSIYGYAQYLRYAKATEEERCEGLMYIMEESGRLARMSETMLTMRLYEKEERKLEKVSLQVVAARLQKILAGKLQEKNLTIRMEFEEETVFAEETLLLSLFRNLLENAIRASHAGYEIVFRSYCEKDKQVFEVIDHHTGNGRKPEYSSQKLRERRLLMKKKNLLVIGMASGLCLVFMLILIGSMGIYAEKSGTMEQEPEVEENRKSDMLTGMLTEDGRKAVGAKDSAKDGATAAETKDGAGDAAETGRMPEEELKAIWEKMYREYEGNAKDGESPQEPADDVKISVSEAGLIWLQEIHRLYPGDALEDLSIDFMEPESGINIVYWTGKLENGYGASEEGYRSYTCQIDPVSGKIVSFGKFQPYQKEKDYSAISWTDEEIKARAKELIERYDLSLGEELEWDSVEVYSGKEEAASLKEEFAERPGLSKSVCNTLFFKKDGLPVYDFCMDWETGEISNYLWVEKELP